MMSKKILIDKIKKARFIWIIGNGGSLSTAEHFANDLLKKGYKAIALTNPSVISMLANDYGYEYIFSKQLEVLATEEDLLVTISCSGESKNILKARNSMKDLVDDPACLEEVYEFETFRYPYNSGFVGMTLEDYGKLEDKHLKFVHEVVEAL